MNAVAQLPQREPTAAESSFALTVKQARALAASELVPKSYQGEAGLANVMVALEIANRIGASPLSVMQSLHIIQGRPSWSASFLIATVNACGRFSPLRFETEGDDPADKAYRVRAHAKDKDTGEVCAGPWITWKMVDAEGWSKKSGSKWLTMPGLMFMYRAAAFWTRVYAPELSLGIHTAEEVQDIVLHPSQPQRAELADLQQALINRGAIEHQPETVDTQTGEILPTKTPTELKAACFTAESMAELEALKDQVKAIEDEAVQADVQDAYDVAVERLS